MAKTYADTQRTISSFDGSEILVVQDGSTPAPGGFAEMKKTTLGALRTFFQDGVAHALAYRGSCTWAQLQSKTGMKVGDMWNVTDRDGQNYAWTGTEWDALGETLDISGKADVTYVDEKVAEAKPKDYEAVKERVTDLEEGQDGLTSSLTEVAETVEAHDVIIDETSKTASDNKARLHGYDFRKVDRDALFVLDGDGEASLKQMMDSVEAYAQDAIMLSLEPIIPTASQHNFGIRGQIACDNSYLYVCVAENEWKKIPLQSL